MCFLPQSKPSPSLLATILSEKNMCVKYLSACALLSGFAKQKVTGCLVPPGRPANVMGLNIIKWV
ncbi:unnamed protein product [Arctogadus glacialis]